MKTLCIALGLLLALQGAWSHSEEVKECGEEHAVKASDFKMFFETKEASQDVKCFMKCVLMHKKVLKDDGSFDADAAKEHDVVSMDVFKQCSADLEKNDDLCEMAYQHSLCVLEKDPKKEKIQADILEHLE